MPLTATPSFKVYSPKSEYTLYGSFQKKNVYQVLAFVIIVHALISILITFGLPDFKFVKRPDITIELGAAPPASSGPVSQNQAKPVIQPVPPVPKEPPKEKKPPISKDKDALVAPASTQRTQSSQQTSAPSSSAVAAAPTMDANYKAAYLQNPKPPYPPLAFKTRIEGKVIILAEVLPDGRAGKVIVSKSSGHELLDQSALTTVRQWKFTPARKDGVIVTQAVRIPITFSLKNR